MPLKSLLPRLIRAICAAGTAIGVAQRVGGYTHTPRDATGTGARDLIAGHAARIPHGSKVPRGRAHQGKTARC